ncbi:MBL fold metallo-hydrolase [Foetidibacter luteolus]|uniref:MBL fold metallo-hydrolase n=1 Tax=Foetidibacter luteolus TaxID=2608880 RepID=UPI00129B995F|nr:3',5'-cyclic-nucleotide phosphodiesterase [Foetidibacter luteolus]
MNSIFRLLLPLLLANNIQAQDTFTCIPLGVKGGIDESNLSSYMLGVKGSQQYICLDAGTLHAGLQKAAAKGIFKQDAATVLKQNIKGYCISHPHLDHLAGLIINSPDDTSKYIYGLPHCLNIIKDKYFSWKSWANFGDAGEQPALGKYHYVELAAKETEAANTGLHIKAYALSHVNPYESTAFLVRHNDSYVLYLGDTGADEVEKSTRLQQLWQAVAPIIRAHQLKGIFIEVSYPDEQPSNKLFGHLTPALLMKEMQQLGNLAGKESIAGLPVVITHIKPSGNNEATIYRQLTEQNKLQLKLIFPEQATPFDL